MCVHDASLHDDCDRWPSARLTVHWPYVARCGHKLMHSIVCYETGETMCIIMYLTACELRQGTVASTPAGGASWLQLELHIFNCL